jgi:ABC-type nitrate/sulfonate/bicarbonate transport system substrate-binding protein
MTHDHEHILAVPDLISPSYFPAIAAVELGCIQQQGIDMALELRFPVTAAVEALRAGEFSFVAGAAHTLFHNAADAGDTVLLGSLSHNMYWFLVVRADLGIERNADLRRLAGLRIGAAPGPDAGLAQMLVDSGVGPGEVEIGPIPGTAESGISFGISAAEALRTGRIDGFWANGMGAEVARRNGVGTVVVDARRGDGPAGAIGYTFASLMCTRRLANDSPELACGVLAGVIDAQQRLRKDPQLATQVADKLFPPMEAELTPALIARDVPYYDPAISARTVESLIGFAQQRGLTSGALRYEDLVYEHAPAIWSERS